MQNDGTDANHRQHRFHLLTDRLASQAFPMDLKDIPLRRIDCRLVPRCEGCRAEGDGPLGSDWGFRRVVLQVVSLRLALT